MDELSMLRAARPQDAYADERREAARDRLLAEATGSAPARRRALRSTRSVRRISRPWQVGLAAALAVGVTLTVAGTYRAGGGTHIPGTHTPGAEATASSAARVLLLAADAAQQSAPPPGARWLVWGDQVVSTAAAQKTCGGTAKSVTAQAYAKLRSLASCQAEPPASLPELRHARTVSGDGYPGLGPLPDQPAALLRSVERFYAAYYQNNGDRLPGHPVPPLTRPELYAGAFDVLRTLLDSGATSPSPTVQLRALALIPGTKVVTGARNAAGQPGIAVTITSPDPAQTGFSQEEIIFDSHTYQDVGGVLVEPDQYATGGSVTISTTRTWQAYYDAAGHRL
jgi:hypothetical protein